MDGYVIVREIERHHFESEDFWDFRRISIFVFECLSVLVEGSE